MDKLKKLLMDVNDSYFDFVIGIMAYVKNDINRCNRIISFINENPKATTSDIIEFVSDQPDFREHMTPKASASSI